MLSSTADVILRFTGQCPRTIYDFVLGLNRRGTALEVALPIGKGAPKRAGPRRGPPARTRVTPRASVRLQRAAATCGPSPRTEVPGFMP